MGFRPVLEKETSIFTAEAAFLLTWAFPGRSSAGALCRVDLPCQVSCQALSPQRCKTAKVGVCVCEISRCIHLGAQGVRWLQISAGAAGHQVAEQDQEGEWKPE